MPELDDSPTHHQRAEMDTEIGHFSFEGTGEFVSSQTRHLLSILETIVLKMMDSGVDREEVKHAAITEQEIDEDDFILTGGQAAELADFLASLGVTSHQERYGVILCWLEGNKNISEVSSSELEEIYTQLKTPLPQHPSQIFWDAKSRKGWFEGTDREGYYQLSEKGRHFVEGKLVG